MWLINGWVENVFFGDIAQQVERHTVNVMVGGSIPSFPAKLNITCSYNSRESGRAGTNKKTPYGRSYRARIGDTKVLYVGSSPTK